MMKLSELLQPLRYNQQLATDPDVLGLEMDSRKVTPGTVFFCVKGHTVDGHDYALQAEKRGAVAIIAERELPVSIPVIVVNDSRRAMARLANHFYRYPTEKLRLIGVTGTNGKTTVTHLLEQIMRDAGSKTGLIGTMYTKIDDVKYETKNTTPESLTLQKIFDQMVKENVDTVMMEVSSHALHQGRVRGCDFDIAVFTNLTPDHLDYHDSLEAYMYAKGLLFAQLGNRYEGKVAVLNNDDPVSVEIARMTTADIITYGIKEKSDVIAKEIDVTATGTTFVLEAFGETVTVRMKLIGLFSVYNALAAAAAGLASGIPLSSIQASLEKVKGVPGRFETVDASQDFTVIVDYAHTPDSLENVLKTARQFAKNRLTVVVGCGGDRDRTKRPVMGKIAATYADRAIFTSDNPRSEDPKQIINDMIGDLNEEQYEVILDRKEAIKSAIRDAKTDDVVIIAGKGHETYQILRDQTIRFDDREVAREAIKERLSQC